MVLQLIKYCLNRLNSCKIVLLDCTDAQERQIVIESQNNLVWKDVESLAGVSFALLGLCMRFFPNTCGLFPVISCISDLQSHTHALLSSLPSLVKTMTTKTTFPRNVLYLLILHWSGGCYVLVFVSVCCNSCLLFLLAIFGKQHDGHKGPD